MKDLKECRAQINEIDEKIMDLFKDRMEVVKAVLEYKKAHNLAVFDVEREKQMVKDHFAYLNDKELEEYYYMFLDGMLKASVKYQNDHYND